MRRFLCILMCLSMASAASALSITNGDFEALGIREDVPDWFDYDMYVRNNQGILEQILGASGTYLRLLHSPTGTQYMSFADDDCWAYQSIGHNTGGVSALQIQYDIGAVEGGYADEPLVPRDLVLIVSIYESDGSFVGSDGPDSSDIDGADGITLIDSVTVSYPAMEVGQYVTDIVTLQYLNSAGGELFLRFANEGDDDDDTDDRFAIDNVQILELPSIVNPFPKNGTEHVAIERTSAENDLVFTVADVDIVKVDVRFGTDPNLPPADTIVDDMSVSPGQYTITLESELAEDLNWSTEYSWKVLAYEPNGIYLSLKYASPVWSFTTIQKGPYLGDVIPGDQGVWAGEDAVFSVEVEDYSKTDTFQWRYYPNAGDPNMALTDGTDYTGVHTATLTVLNAQLDDAGFYYCVGTETATGLSADSTSAGELFIKELKAHYPFETTDGDFTPDVIGGKNMQLIGGASLSADNSIVGNNLLLVNPGNQWARIIDSSVADYEDITISFWFNATTLERWAVIFEFGSGATDYVMFTPYYRQDDPRQNGLDIARCEFRYPDPEDPTDILNPELDVESVDISAGNWYYVAITIKDKRGRIYFGGQRGTEYDSPQELNVPSMTDITKTNHYIGKRFAYGDPDFNGRIDEFKIYNFAMSSDEIAQEFFGVSDDETICDMEAYDLYDWDFNRNCKVDLPDFAEMAVQWLVDYRIFPD